MGILQLEPINGRMAAVAPGGDSNFVIVDYVEECGLVQVRCPLTETGRAPSVCPSLCPIIRCEARDARDRNRV